MVSSWQRSGGRCAADANKIGVVPFPMRCHPLGLDGVCADWCLGIRWTCRALVFLGMAIAMEKVAMPWRFRLLASSPWWLGVLHPSSWSLGVMFRSWSGARSPHVSSLVVLHHVASPVCWSDWTEVDDFLAAKNLSTLHKIMPAKCRAAPDLPMPRPRCFFVMLHLRCDGSTGQRLTTSRSRRIRPHSTR